MKILVACEESQVVTTCLRYLGHDAYSCDILPTSGQYPEYHYKQDLFSILDSPEFDFDCMIAFPPCTDLAVSGARWFPEKRKNGSQQKSIDFFMRIANHSCPKIGIENPIGIMSSVYRKPDQIIQPWQFGHGETKSTCLWLKGLPLLVPTDIVHGREQRIWKLPPSADRAKLRSKTYFGIAMAMAYQWTKN